MRRSRTGTRSGFLYEPAAAAERVAAAAAEVRYLGIPFVLTARAENHLRGNPDLDDTIARLRSYARAGADCLYAPGLRTVDEIRAVCGAVGRPVNVLAIPSLSVADIVGAGAQRISVGGAPDVGRRRRDGRRRRGDAAGQPRRARGLASDRRLAQLSSRMRSASAEWRRRPSARPTAIVSARRSPTSTHSFSARVTAV